MRDGGDHPFSGSNKRGQILERPGETLARKGLVHTLNTSHIRWRLSSGNSLHQRSKLSWEMEGPNEKSEDLQKLHGA